MPAIMWQEWQLPLVRSMATQPPCTAGSVGGFALSLQTAGFGAEPCARETGAVSRLPSKRAAVLAPRMTLAVFRITPPSYMCDWVAGYRWSGPGFFLFVFV